MGNALQDPVSSARYTEGCHALRHYSLGVLRVRAIAVAQGFAVLAAAGYFVREQDLLYAMAVTVFGLAFTAVLYSLQVNYWKHFVAVLNYVTDLEAVSPPSTMPSHGPWSAYETQRAQRFEKLPWKILTIHGPYLLLLAALLFLLIYALITTNGRPA